MKTYILLTLCLVFGLNLSAQNVSQKEMAMSLGNQNAFVVDLEGADDGLAEDVWKDYLKDYGKVKRNKKAGEYYCEDCAISIISSSPMQVTLILDERKDMTVASAFFDTGSSFITEEGSDVMAEKAEKFMYNYALDVKRKVIENELKEQEKELKNFNKDQEKLEKANKGYHNDIEKAKKQIVEAEENIEQNLKDQEAKQIEIKNQMKLVEEVTERLNSVGKN